VLTALTIAVRATPPILRSATVSLSLLTTGAAAFLAIRECHRAQPDLPPDEPVQLIGIVAEEPVARATSLRFTLEVTAVRASGPFIPAAFVGVVTARHSATSPAHASYGERLLLRGLIDTPPGARNPGEFNSRDYHAAMGVTREIFVASPEAIVVLDHPPGVTVYERLVLRARRGIVRDVDTWVGGEEGELLKGLLLGEKGGLTRETRDAFIVSGVAHVLAVSGSNVAVVAGLALSLCMILRTGRTLRAAIVALTILWYMALTGAQPPVVRATITALVLLAAGLREEKANPLNGLGVSAVIILAINPLTLFDIGFQLSYGAVLAIVLFTPMMNDVITSIHGQTLARRVLRGGLRLGAVSVAATVGTIPFSAASFGSVSVIGIVANMIVVPATGLGVALGLAMAITAPFSGWLAGAFGALNGSVLKLTLWVTGLAARVPAAAIRVGAFEALDASVYLAVLAAALALMTRRYCRIIVPLALLLLHARLVTEWYKAECARPRPLTLTILDVGQGDAILITTPLGKSVLVDAGPATPGFDAGERTVVPFLRRQGIDTLDLLLVTHAHRDHTGGVGGVRRSIPVRRVLGGSGWGGDGCAFDVGQAGMEVSPDPTVRFYVLSPDGKAEAARGSDNLRSVVVLLRVGERGILLTGDCEGGAEESIVRRYGAFIRADVLKVPHHGSATGTTESFLDRCRPELAVISVGRRNGFGHPSRHLIDRLARRGIVTWRTDREGACLVETDGQTVQLVEWREPPLL
jgi:competence protein ComEC